jgi:hypothetical protein
MISPQFKHFCSILLLLAGCIAIGGLLLVMQLTPAPSKTESQRLDHYQSELSKLPRADLLHEAVEEESRVVRLLEGLGVECAKAREKLLATIEIYRKYFQGYISDTTEHVKAQ